MQRPAGPSWRTSSEDANVGVRIGKESGSSSIAGAGPPQRAGCVPESVARRQMPMHVFAWSMTEPISCRRRRAGPRATAVITSRRWEAIEYTAGAVDSDLWGNPGRSIGNTTSSTNLGSARAELSRCYRVEVSAMLVARGEISQPLFVSGEGRVSEPWVSRLQAHVFLPSQCIPRHERQMAR